MADFLDTVKNKVSSAVSRTSWEAQKQMRLRSKQTEIDRLLEQREKLLNDLAQAALDLHQKGALNDPRLVRVCSSIQELDHDVQNRESQLLEIKKEAYPAQQLTPNQTTDYTSAPPTYTPPAASTPPPAAQQPAASAPANQSQVNAVICPSCGNPVRPNALYCRNCGAKLR